MGAAGPRLPGAVALGLGWGFSARAGDGRPDGTTGRADGLSLYLRRGATAALAAVLGPAAHVYGPHAKSWAERRALQTARKRQLLASRGGPRGGSPGGAIVASPSSGAGGPAAPPAVAGASPSRGAKSPATSHGS